MALFTRQYQQSRVSGEHLAHGILKFTAGIDLLLDFLDPFFGDALGVSFSAGHEDQRPGRMAFAFRMRRRTHELGARNHKRWRITASGTGSSRPGASARVCRRATRAGISTVSKRPWPLDEATWGRKRRSWTSRVRWRRSKRRRERCPKHAGSWRALDRTEAQKKSVLPV